MLPIKIDIINIDNYYNIKEKYLISYHFNFKTLIIPVVFFIIGISSLITGLLSDYDVEFIKHSESQKEVALRNYGLDVGMGCGLMLFSILNFIQKTRPKSQYKTILRIKQSKLKHKNSSLEFELTDSNLQYKSEVDSWVRNWEYFNYFKIDDQLLVLFSGYFNAKIPEVIIPINTISSQQRKFLKAYLKGKLEYLNN